LVVDDGSFENSFDFCVVPSCSPPYDSSLTDYLTFPYWLDDNFSISAFSQPTFSQIEPPAVSIPDSGQALLAISQDPFFWATQDNLNNDPFASFQERLDQNLEYSSWHSTSDNLAPSVPIRLEATLPDSIFFWDEPLSLSTITPTSDLVMGAQSESSSSVASSTEIPSRSSDPPSSGDKIHPPANGLSSTRSYSNTPSSSESLQDPKQKSPPGGHLCQWNGCLKAFDEISQLRYYCPLCFNNSLLTRDPKDTPSRPHFTSVKMHVAEMQ
jgi:hypothetical protein